MEPESQQEIISIQEKPTHRPHRFFMVVRFGTIEWRDLFRLADSTHVTCTTNEFNAT